MGATDKPWKCPKCGKFYAANSRQEHAKTHGVEYWFHYSWEYFGPDTLMDCEAPECRARFATKKGYAKHFASYHKEQETGDWECGLCARPFTTGSRNTHALRAHGRSWYTYPWRYLGSVEIFSCEVAGCFGMAESYGAMARHAAAAHKVSAGRAQGFYTDLPVLLDEVSGKFFRVDWSNVGNPVIRETDKDDEYGIAILDARREIIEFAENQIAHFMAVKSIAAKISVPDILENKYAAKYDEEGIKE